MMSEQKSGPFVNLIKKAVGMPTGDSACCGAAPTQESTSATSAKETAGSCCGSAPAKESANDCCGTEAATAKKSNSCCG